VDDQEFQKAKLFWDKTTDLKIKTVNFEFNIFYKHLFITAVFAFIINLQIRGVQ
jgi:hypothetical protein